MVNCSCFAAPNPSVEFYRKLDLFIGPQLTNLANIICEQTAKKQLGYGIFRKILLLELKNDVGAALCIAIRKVERGFPLEGVLIGSKEISLAKFLSNLAGLKLLFFPKKEIDNQVYQFCKK